jgi:CubicO group peptidase (beta-lactamase class C family)
MKEGMLQNAHVGEQTRFSNYGIALAGYVIEQIVGMPFHRYVHQNIFVPLNMYSTALLPDLSDNNWVDGQRDEVQTYLALETKEVGRRYQALLYPSGAATGTMRDMVKFGQGLMPDESGTSPLFERSETVMKLYPEHEDILPDIIFYNGFIIFHVGNESNRVLGHHGNFGNGFTATLMIDIDEGVGVVIVENSDCELSFHRAEDFRWELLRFIFESELL